jgi:RNA polymerase sigma-70 factor (sigma-E family)
MMDPAPGRGPDEATGSSPATLLHPARAPAGGTRSWDARPGTVAVDAEAASAAVAGVCLWGEEPDGGFARFVMARSRALTRAAYLLTGDHHVAEDLVQEALGRAAGCWRRIQGDPEPYVRRIIYNQNVSRWRRHRSAEVGAERLPQTAVPGHADAVVRRLTLREALLRLPPRQRAAVVLRFYEDLSEAETARVLGCSVGTPKDR